MIEGLEGKSPHLDGVKEKLKPLDELIHEKKNIQNRLVEGLLELAQYRKTGAFKEGKNPEKFIHEMKQLKKQLSNIDEQMKDIIIKE